jgi:hypothetical protein
MADGLDATAGSKLGFADDWLMALAFEVRMRRISRRGHRRG